MSKRVKVKPESRLAHGGFVNKTPYLAASRGSFAATRSSTSNIMLIPESLDRSTSCVSGTWRKSLHEDLLSSSHRVFKS